MRYVKRNIEFIQITIKVSLIQTVKIIVSHFIQNMIYDCDW